MQIPGYPLYEWKDGKVFNTKTNKFLDGGVRRRVRMTHESGERFTLTLEEIEAMMLTQHPRDMEGVVEGANGDTWFHKGHRKAYQELDGKIYVLRWTGKDRINVSANGKIYRVTEEEFLNKELTNLKRFATLRARHEHASNR